MMMPAAALSRHSGFKIVKGAPFHEARMEWSTHRSSAPAPASGSRPCNVDTQSRSARCEDSRLKPVRQVRAHLDSTTTSVAGILPLLPPREERAGERKAILL